MISLLLASAFVGGCQHGGATYATPYVARTYQAATYTNNYAPAAFAVDPNYYATAVATYVRQQATAAAQAQAQADLANKLSQLTTTVEALTTRLSQPQPQPVATPVPAPAYASPQTPVVPTKTLEAPTPNPSPQVPSKSWSYPQDGTPPPPPAPAPPPTAPGGFLPGVGVSSADTTNRALTTALVRNKCNSCHSGSGAAGDVQLFDSAGNLAALSFDEVMKVGKAIRDNRMPPRGPAVPAADRAIIFGAFRSQILASADSLMK